MSQSPEGLAGNFHRTCSRRPPRAVRRCLNTPKGSPAISTELNGFPTGDPDHDVSIPRRARRQFPPTASSSARGRDSECLNPPKGSPAISTRILVVVFLIGVSVMSQSPEGLAGNFHHVLTRTFLTFLPRYVSILRRARRQFPLLLGILLGASPVLVSIPRRARRQFPRCKVEQGTETTPNHVSIPRRARRQFPRREGAKAHTSTMRKCLNPPKGSPAISTLETLIEGASSVECLNNPKGSPAISTKMWGRIGRGVEEGCLNPPKGSPAISTLATRALACVPVQWFVSIPRRARRQFPQRIG